MRKNRHGYTLTEVALVCAVLIIAGAVAAPVVSNMFGSSSLDAARDTVRMGLAEARSLAMGSSQSYCFQVMNNSGQYAIIPESQMDSSDPGSLADALPQGVIFNCDPSLGGPGGWSTIAVFHPDGSASRDAEIGLRSQKSGNTIFLRLRASTGSVALAPGTTHNKSL